jgi:hypothetical protein
LWECPETWGIGQGKQALELRLGARAVSA